MNVPPLLLACVLLFWGWEAGFLPAAIIGALILELPRRVRWRWDFSPTDMNRVWDLCGVLFLGAGVYAYATTDVIFGPIRFMTWLPMLLFPFVMAVQFSAQDNVTSATYFLIVRLKKRGARPQQSWGKYVPYWYLAVCIASASIVNVRDARFYSGVVVIGAWLLWLSRNRSAPVWVWAVMIAVATVAGFGGQIGLTRLQAIIEYRASRLLANLGEPDIELNQIRTAIGSVGRLPLSSRIVLRVQTDEHYAPLELLRTASFDKYLVSGNRSSWSATDSKFKPTYPSSDDVWEFAPATGSLATATITMFLPRGKGILPCPSGPTVISNVVAGAVETNHFGSVRVSDANPLTRYSVHYGDHTTLDGPPAPNDLVIPDVELPALEQVAAELKLAGQPPTEILHRVETYFLTRFTYTQFSKAPRFDPLGHATALSQFLLQDHAGHCQYFATATTLLLRQAGVPARYAIGYAVPPQADSDNVHIVRGLHAHAWVLAYVNGSWRDFDTTPGTWEDVEEAEKSHYQSISDFFTGIWYHYSAWRFYGDRTVWAKRALWLIPLLVLWLVWRLFSQKRHRRAQQAAPLARQRLRFGLDSEFYRIEQHLAKAGVPRHQGESLHDWLRRLEATRQTAWSIPTLREIIALHYQYRFDPQGLPADKRRELKAKVERWLGNVAAAKPASA